MAILNDMGDTIDISIAKIDAQGGWNPLATEIKFYHSIDSFNRPTIWTKNNNDIKTGAYLQPEWYTTYLTADEYYLYKLSPKAKARIEKEVRRKIAHEIVFGR